MHQYSIHNNSNTYNTTNFYTNIQYIQHEGMHYEWSKNLLNIMFMKNESYL